MLNLEEKKVLEIVNKKLLMSRSELKNMIDLQGLADCIQLLKDHGYVEILQPAGETCVAITQKGMRAVA